LGTSSAASRFSDSRTRTALCPEPDRVQPNRSPTRTGGWNFLVSTTLSAPWTTSSGGVLLPGCPPTPRLLNQAITAFCPVTCPQGKRTGPTSPVRPVPRRTASYGPSAGRVQTAAPHPARSPKVLSGARLVVHGPGNPRGCEPHALAATCRAAAVSARLESEGPRSQDAVVALLQHRRHHEPDIDRTWRRSRIRGHILTATASPGPCSERAYLRSEALSAMR